MTFTGTVWRHVPRGAHPLDFSHLISASGRWNRAGFYGCLYTAVTPEGAAAEYRKHQLRRGLYAARDLVSLSVRVEHVLDLAGLMEDADPGRRQVAVPGRLRGRAPGFRILPDIDPTWLTGDGPADLEQCCQIADWARRMGFLAIRAASAALPGAITLAIYPENRPGKIQLAVEGEEYRSTTAPSPSSTSTERRAPSTRSRTGGMADPRPLSTLVRRLPTATPPAPPRTPPRHGSTPGQLVLLP